MIELNSFKIFLGNTYGEVIINEKVSPLWTQFFQSHTDLKKLLDKSNLTYDKLDQTIISILGRSPRCSPELLIFRAKSLGLKLTNNTLYSNFFIKNKFQIQASIIMYIFIINSFSSFFPKLYISVEVLIKDLTGIKNVNSDRRIDFVINLSDKIKVLIEFNEESHKESKDFDKMTEVFKLSKRKVLQFYEMDTDIHKFLPEICNNILIQLDDKMAKEFYSRFYNDDNISNMKIIQERNKYYEHTIEDYKKKKHSLSGENTICYRDIEDFSDYKDDGDIKDMDIDTDYDENIKDMDIDYDSEIDDNSNYDRYDSSSDYEP